MLFRIANASPTFQNMIIKILQYLINQCIIIYINDISIYLVEKKESQCVVIEVLQSLN
jgi:hypothetical protein